MVFKCQSVSRGKTLEIFLSFRCKDVYGPPVQLICCGRDGLRIRGDPPFRRFNTTLLFSKLLIKSELHSFTILEPLATLMRHIHARISVPFTDNFYYNSLPSQFDFTQPTIHQIHLYSHIGDHEHCILCDNDKILWGKHVISKFPLSFTPSQIPLRFTRSFRVVYFSSYLQIFCYTETGDYRVSLEVLVTYLSPSLSSSSPSPVPFSLHV